MRKFILSIVATTAVMTLLHAEGYQLNLNSAKQGGMGNAGVALKLGAESMIYNPAGLAFIDGKAQFSAGVTAIKSFIDYSNGSYSEKTNNPLGTPLYVYAGFKISNNLAAGVSLNNPAGNSIFWPDNWKGAILVQNSSLKAFSAQPTLSFKFLDDMLSVGAGAMIMWGNFSNVKALIPVNGLAGIGVAAPPYKPFLDKYSDVVPVSAKLSGDAKMGVGFNIGVLFSPIPELSIGLSYRSKVDLKVDDGQTEINYVDPEMKQFISDLPAAFGVVIPPLDKGRFAASMPLPANFNAGLSYHFCDNTLITAEVVWVGWKVAEKLEIQYDKDAMNIKSEVPKFYKNTLIYRLGGQWTAFPSFDVRAGVYYDTTPVDKDLYYSPETPGSNKLALTCGWSWRPTGGLSVDFAFVYSHGGEVTGNFTGSPFAANNPFSGTYKVHAFLPSLGLSYTF
ncbi:MAG: outer membrane protein transport protein [Prevotellaceae bacterium]|jgi:long-chain fatty acid transport protein|nr:outer membrane protein transport protein [Prevotellaceae bacterium]